jgi:hypothetical protein
MQIDKFSEKSFFCQTRYIGCRRFPGITAAFIFVLWLVFALRPRGPRCRKATVSEASTILRINLDAGASAKVAFLATEFNHIAVF